MKTKYIGSAEAAEILGVTSQTIRTMAKEGAIPYRLVGNIFKFKKKDVEAMIKDVEGVKDAEITLLEIERKLREEAKYKHVSLHEMYERRAELLAKALPERSLSAMTYIWQNLYEAFLKETDEENPLNSRDRDILRLLLEGYSCEYVAVKNGLTRERVRQIREKAIKKLRDMRSMPQIIHGLKEENARLHEELKQKSEQVEFLQAAFETAQKPLPKDPLKDIDRNVLNIPIKSLGLSTRAMNCLRYLDVKTVRDLTKVRRIDILHVRNIGKKTFNEIDELMFRMGLEFAEEKKSQ